MFSSAIKTDVKGIVINILIKTISPDQDKIKAIKPYFNFTFVFSCNAINTVYPPKNDLLAFPLIIVNDW